MPRLTAPLRQLAFRTSTVQRAFDRTRQQLRFRAMSSAALTHGQYPFLASLGIKESNAGVFNGKFVEGEGEVFTSINPATNEKIATITTGSAKQLEVRTQKSARDKWNARGMATWWKHLAHSSLLSWCPLLSSLPVMRAGDGGREAVVLGSAGSGPW